MLAGPDKLAFEKSATLGLAKICKEQARGVTVRSRDMHSYYVRYEIIYISKLFHFTDKPHFNVPPVAGDLELGPVNGVPLEAALPPEPEQAGRAAPSRARTVLLHGAEVDHL